MAGAAELDGALSPLSLSNMAATELDPPVPPPDAMVRAPRPAAVRVLAPQSHDAAEAGPLGQRLARAGGPEARAQSGLQQPADLDGVADGATASRPDGFSWRKYGCKIITGASTPRSYFRCNVPGCPAKKQVQLDDDGIVNFLRYDGEHSHEGQRAPGAPAPRDKAPKRAARAAAVDAELQNGDGDGDDGEAAQAAGGGHERKRRKAAVAAVAAVAAAAAGDGWQDDEGDEDEDGGDAAEGGVGGGAVGAGKPKTVDAHSSAPREVCLETDVDVLDDGWRWRKYGQKFVHGNEYPRSYYKCTTPGCPMRKHVERSTRSPKTVVSTYEGAHNHTRPANGAPRGGAAIPGRPSCAALRDAAAVIDLQQAKEVAVHRTPAARPKPAAPKHSPAVTVPRGGASANGVPPSSCGAKRPGFKPPPLTIPTLLPLGDDIGLLPSFGPATALGRLPLSAVLAGADDDMVNASMTLLDSAKGTGLRPFARDRNAFPAPPSNSAFFDSLGGGRSARGGLPGAGLLAGGWTPVTSGAALDAVVGFLNLDTPSFRFGGTGFASGSPVPPVPQPTGVAPAAT